MNNLRSYLLLILIISCIPNLYISSMKQGSRGNFSKKSPGKKCKKINNILAWLPHGEKDVCDCPEIDSPYNPTAFSELTPSNVMNSFWEKIAQGNQEEKDEALKIAINDYYYKGKIWRCGRRFIAAAVEIGADPNIEYVYGTSLYHALSQQDYPLTKFLLNHDANPNLKIDGLDPALFNSTKITLAILLLRHNANFKAKGHYNMTLLHKVMNKRYEADLVQLYTAKGVDANASEDLFGNAPLHMLAYCCQLPHSSHIDVEEVRKKVDILLAAGASLSAINREGFTPAGLIQEKINNSALCDKNVAYTLLKMLQDAKSKSISKR